jgi:hypothetical protein
MFRTISRSSLLVFGLTLGAATAFAEEPSEPRSAADRSPSEVVFVSATAPEINQEPHSDFDEKVAAMVENEQMLDLIARLSTATPAS